MTTMEKTTYHGTRCDARGCERTITTQQTLSVDDVGSEWGPEWKAHQAAAADDGWAAYIGRSVYEYCPQHGPAIRKPEWGIYPDPMRCLWGTRPDYDAQAQERPARSRHAR